MRILLRIVIALVALGVLLLLIGFVLPGGYEVQRSAVIAASPDKLWTRAATLKTWNDWTEWNTRQDPTLKYQFSGPETGQGSSMSWTAEKLGNGQLTIVEATPGKSFRYEMNMTDVGLTSQGTVELVADGAGTKATWRASGKLGANPIYRWMGLLLIDPMLGGTFETNFKNLKAWAEAPAK